MSPAPPMPRQFRVRLEDGTDLGTMTEERAIELIRKGVIERGDRIQRVGSERWRNADEVARHVFEEMERGGGDPSEASFIGEVADAALKSAWPSADPAAPWIPLPDAPPAPPAPPGWWRRNMVPIVAVAAGVMLVVAVAIPLFVSQARAQAAHDFNAALVAESISLVDAAAKGDPAALLPRFDAWLATFASPEHPLDEQAVAQRAAVEAARSRLYWSTRRFEPEFLKVEALAGRAKSAADAGQIPAAEGFVSQARGALPKLPDPLPATIDARRAAEPMLAIEAAESAIRTAKEAEAARDRAARLRAEQERAEASRAESARQAAGSAQRAVDVARADRARRGGVLTGSLDRAWLGALDTMESGGRPQVLVFRERSDASAGWGSKCVDTMTGWVNASAQEVTIPPYSSSSAARAKLAIGRMVAARDAMRAIAAGGGGTSTFLASLCVMTSAHFSASMSLWESWVGGGNADAIILRERGMRNAWDIARSGQDHTLSWINVLKLDALVAAADIAADGSFTVSGIPPGEYVVFSWIHDGERIANWVKRFTVDGPGDYTLKLDESGAIAFLRKPMLAR